MLFVTGDCHGDFRRFSALRFPWQKLLTKEDFVLVCGDFGGLWNGKAQEGFWLDWLEDKPFTTLFVDGNHENFDLLEFFRPVPWRGGLIRQIRPSVFHLCRGSVFDLDGKKLFVMGGAASHDMPDGILRQGPALKQQRKALDRRRAHYRVEHESWWRQELPSQEEYRRALENLDAAHWAVDLVVTHCAPTELHTLLRPSLPPDELTEFLSRVRRELSYGAWYCGHYHCDKTFPRERFRVLDDLILPVNWEEGI